MAVKTPSLDLTAAQAYSDDMGLAERADEE